MSICSPPPVGGREDEPVTAAVRRLQPGRRVAELAPEPVDRDLDSVLVDDLAGAWALRPDGQPMLPLTPGEPRQREFAYRAGVNIVMYTLTGNYKADQVHMPALIERLGQ